MASSVHRPVARTHPSLQRLRRDGRSDAPRRVREPGGTSRRRQALSRLFPGGGGLGGRRRRQRRWCRGGDRWGRGGRRVGVVAGIGWLGRETRCCRIR